MNSKETLFKFINNSIPDMISLQKILNAVPALAPENDGDGEMKKAEALIRWFNKEGVSDIERIDVPDSRVTEKVRPNIIVSIPGKSEKKTIWVMSHLDVVPPGERTLWARDPYTLIEKDGRLYGRGVEDNHQGLVASVFAALSFLKTGIMPAYTVKLLFVADEEVGSDYGIKYLLKNYNLFKKDDFILVPDGGRSEGDMIVVAEKNLLWLKFITTGKQCHASMPGLGINAFTAASDLVLKLNGLNSLFKDKNDLFDPPVSTFVPTKKENNVPNINTLPGEDVFYLDCRILPVVKIDTVLTEIDKICKAVQAEYNVKIKYKIVQRVESKPIPEDCSLVKALQTAIEDVYKIRAVPVGIGGGTVAAHLRNDGFYAVVWSKLDETAHMPNEYCIIDNMTGDSKVMSMFMLNG